MVPCPESPMSNSPSPARAHRLENFVRLRELSRGEFGVNLVSIDADLKRAAARRHERERMNGLLESQQFFRQTDGMWLVVSSGAIFDGNFQSHDGHETMDGRAGGQVKRPLLAAVGQGCWQSLPRDGWCVGGGGWSGDWVAFLGSLGRVGCSDRSTRLVHRCS